MKLSTRLLLKKVIKEEVRKVLKEAKGSAKGFSFPYDDGKKATMFLKAADSLGMKQGQGERPENATSPNRSGADYFFVYNDLDGAEIYKGPDGRSTDPEGVVILNPQMLNNPEIKAALARLRTFDASWMV